MIYRGEPVLTPEERDSINGGAWFSSLSASLRHDILRAAQVKRFENSEQLAARGDLAKDWVGCAKGAVRISASAVNGKPFTLTYVEPGIWFGDISIFDGGRRTHDAFSHGETTVLSVSRERLQDILSHHVELYEAFMRLHSRRIRNLFTVMEDLHSLPLRARLVKQIRELARGHGELDDVDGSIHIRLRIGQEEFARLLGASRQRVNAILKAFEREQIIRQSSCGLIVCNEEALLKMVG